MHPFFESHPLWVRGLKHVYDTGEINQSLVAPFVGAWIETHIIGQGNVLMQGVAPFVGAWIETIMRTASFSPSEVAPFVGAWIETLRRCF